jgi:hypothetical protein
MIKKQKEKEKGKPCVQATQKKNKKSQYGETI